MRINREKTFEDVQEVIIRQMQNSNFQNYSRIDTQTSRFASPAKERS